MQLLQLSDGNDFNVDEALSFVVTVLLEEDFVNVVDQDKHIDFRAFEWFHER